jgi:branched-chain amino acid transport system substrate-binding protein
MWKQSAQQGFKPKLATVAKVLLFPADTVALGSLVENVATDSFWGPWLHSSSSLTGQTAKQLTDAFQTDTGNQWVQTLGGTYALFEVAKEAFEAASDPHDHKNVAKAMHSVNYSGMAGTINFSTGPAPGVSVIKPLGAQWKKGTGKYPWELQVVDNSNDPSVSTTADLKPTNA